MFTKKAVTASTVAHGACEDPWKPQLPPAVSGAAAAAAVAPTATPTQASEAATLGPTAVGVTLRTQVLAASVHGRSW